MVLAFLRDFFDFGLWESEKIKREKLDVNVPGDFLALSHYASYCTAVDLRLYISCVKEKNILIKFIFLFILWGSIVATHSIYICATHTFHGFCCHFKHNEKRRLTSIKFLTSYIPIKRHLKLQNKPSIRKFEQ